MPQEALAASKSRRADRRVPAICVALALLTAAVYWQVTDFGFLSMDDTEYVTLNPKLENGLTVDSVIWAFKPTYKVANWHPVTWLSLLLDYSLNGLDPSGYHLTNLILHVVSALLLFAGLNRMTGALWRSAFVAALFALHPLQVESVAWVSERKDVLSGLFWMLTLVLYVRYARGPSRSRYALVLIVFALGLMAKQMLVTLPLVLLLLDYWPLRRIGPASSGRSPDRPDGGRVGIRPLLIEKTPMLVMSAAAGAGAMWAQTAGRSIRGLEDFPLGVRAANALVSYLGHLIKIVWPTDLAAFYPHPGATLPEWQVVGSALALVCVTGLAVALAKRWPYVLVGWLWYLVTLLPMIGLMQSGEQAMCDHHTYIPLVGVFVATAWGVPDLIHRLLGGRNAGLLTLGRIATACAAVAVLALLTALTYRQASYWRNDRALFEHAIRVTRGNYVAERALGDALARLGEDGEAKKHYRAAIRAKPEYADAHYNLAHLLLSQGRLKEAESELRSAVRLTPDAARVHTDLGAVLVMRGDFDGAETQFRTAIRLQPEDHKAESNLANILIRRGRIDEAITHLERAVQLAPDHTDYLSNLERAKELQ